LTKDIDTPYRGTGGSLDEGPWEKVDTQ